jgi:hypothetical protein
VNASQVSEPIRSSGTIEEDTMFRTQTTATESLTDDLELTLETLKDLTVTGREAEGVKGGILSAAGGRHGCYCGTM